MAGRRPPASRGPRLADPVTRRARAGGQWCAAVQHDGRGVDGGGAAGPRAAATDGARVARRGRTRAHRHVHATAPSLATQSPTAAQPVVANSPAAPRAVPRLRLPTPRPANDAPSKPVDGDVLAAEAHPPATGRHSADDATSDDRSDRGSDSGRSRSTDRTVRDSDDENRDDENDEDTEQDEVRRPGLDEAIGPTTATRRTPTTGDDQRPTTRRPRRPTTTGIRRRPTDRRQEGPRPRGPGQEGPRPRGPRTTKDRDHEDRDEEGPRPRGPGPTRAATTTTATAPTTAAATTRTTPTPTTDSAPAADTGPTTPTTDRRAGALLRGGPGPPGPPTARLASATTAPASSARLPRCVCTVRSHDRRNPARSPGSARPSATRTNPRRAPGRSSAASRFRGATSTGQHPGHGGVGATGPRVTGRSQLDPLVVPAQPPCRVAHRAR